MSTTSEMPKATLFPPRCSLSAAAIEPGKVWCKTAVWGSSTRGHGRSSAAMVFQSPADAYLSSGKRFVKEAETYRMNGFDSFAPGVA